MDKKNSIFFLTISSIAILIAANYETKIERQEKTSSDYGHLLSDAYKIIEKYELEKGSFDNIDYFKQRSDAVINIYEPQPLSINGLVNRTKNYRELKLEHFELVRFMTGYAKKVSPYDVAMMHAAFDCRVKNISLNHSIDQKCYQLFIKHKNNAIKIVENHLKANNNNITSSHETQTAVRPQIISMMPVVEEGETDNKPVNLASKPIIVKDFVKKEKNNKIATLKNLKPIQQVSAIKPLDKKKEITKIVNKTPVNTLNPIISMAPIVDDTDMHEEPVKVFSKSVISKDFVEKNIFDIKTEPYVYQEINPFTQKIHKVQNYKSIKPNHTPIVSSEVTHSIKPKLPNNSVEQSQKLADNAFLELSHDTPQATILKEEKSISSVMSLRNIVEKALNNNPERLIAVAQYYSSQSQIDVARAGYYPNINLVLGAGREANIPFQQRNEQKDEVGYNNSNNANFRVEQMLFDGFITSETVAQRIKQAKASQLNEKRVSEEIILSAVQIYMQLRQFQKTVIAAEENLNALFDIEELVNMRLKLGDSNRTEKKYLEGRIASAEQNLINAQVGLGNAESSLEFITGERLNFNATLPDIKKDKKFATIENFLGQAFKNNIQVLALNAEKEAAEHQLESVLGRYYPRLDFVVEAGHIEDRGGFTGNVRNGVVKLEMSIPIYDGGTRSALKRQRQAEIEEVAAKQLAFRRRLKQDLKTSYQNRLGAIEQIETAMREIESQLSLEKLNKQQFKYGEKDIFITDLVESRERIFNAKLNKIRAESEYINSYYRIQQSLGEIVPEFCPATCQVI
jgi:adhesin transport system outer membrane protein